MKSSRKIPDQLPKMPTGIEGLDEITGGGLPRGRATLLLGGPGCGKTVLALQTLVNGARDHGESGIFVAFEESAARITTNAASFGWDLPALQRRKLFFLDAQPVTELQSAGGFDLQGLLAALDAKVRKLKPKRIVFDSVDVLLDQLADPMAARREIHRLHEWLLARGLTALITAKADTGQDTYGFMQFMVDCAVGLKHQFVTGVSQRTLCVLKYRGSIFAENESPLVIGPGGLEVAGGRSVVAPVKISRERISSGIRALDAMLAGGYHRGASVLITGSPGTAKTTLSGAFAEAACARGERTLFISFDSEPGEIVRNLASVGIRLERHVRRGTLRLHTKHAILNNAEVHLLRIQALARVHRARCLVVDPISALSKQGNELTAHSVVERLVHWAKTQGMTVVCTSLLARAEAQSEGTPLQISTIADTWMHLSYVIHAGERNRALTIIKSRGTAHSNQVRELVLSNTGITLAEVSTVGGQVLMGAMRWQQEQAEQVEHARLQTEVKRKRLEIEAAKAELQDRVRNLRRELALKETEFELLVRNETERQQTRARGRSVLRKMRGGGAQSK
jgi:circadian clock protein KaiC